VPHRPARFARAALCAALALGLTAACEPDPATPRWAPAFDASAAGALSGVWGAAPDDVWIVGGRPGQGEAYHFDGAAWTPVALPAGTDLLVWVYGFAPDDVLAVGLNGTAVHFDGAAWAALETGVTDTDLWGVFGLAPDDVWVVGGRTGQPDPLLLHYDGLAFTRVALDPAENTRGASQLFKVWGQGDTLFAVGQRGLILRLDGDTWRALPTGPAADQDFISLWGTAPDHIVAVGGRSSARLATWDGAAWTTLAPSAIGGLNAVTLTAPDEALVAGIYGFAATVDLATGTFSPEVAPTSLDLHALWSDGAGRTYAVGGRFVGTYGGVALVRTLAP